MESYIYIDGWKNKIRFSSAHVIPEYEKCGRLHGHTYAVHAKVYGKPDNKGIIIDFSVLKNALRDIVETLDHKILIPEKNKYVEIEKDKDSLKIFMNNKNYMFPEGDCRLLPIDSTSAENLSLYILNCFLEKVNLPSLVESVEIGVDEGFGQGARIVKKLKK